MLAFGSFSGWSGLKSKHSKRELEEIEALDSQSKLAAVKGDASAVGLDQAERDAVARSVGQALAGDTSTKDLNEKQQVRLLTMDFIL